MAAADNGAKMGIEFEFQSLNIILAQTTGQGWPVRADLPGSPGFPTGSQPFCLPQTRADYFVAGPDGAVNWDGDWGIRVVQDSPAAMTLNGANTPMAVLEINTSAKLITDFQFWITARLAAKAFDDTARELEASTAPSAITDGSGGRWMALTTFVAKYNARIDGLVNLDASYGKNRFKIDVNPIFDAYAQGRVPDGHNYLLYVKSSPIDNRDVQLSYSAELGWIYRNIDRWTGMWSSMWWRYPNPIYGASTMDSDIGLKELATTPQIYRNQILVALWKQARDRASFFVPDDRIMDPAQRSIVRGFVTYLLAAGAVTLIQGEPLLKNEFSQLPKTSPASIGRLIGQQYPKLVPFMAELGNLDNATKANDYIRDTMRNLDRLQNNGKLVNAAPAPPGIIDGLDAGTTYTGAGPTQNLVGGADPGNFVAMWRNSLDYTNALIANPNLALTDANKYGYVNTDPFFCNWSGAPGDVKSSFPAKLDAPTGGIRVVFESRYINNLANVGFSPRVLNCMTRRTYFKLWQTYNGEVPKIVVDAFNKYFPDDATIRQTNNITGVGPQSYH